MITIVNVFKLTTIPAQIGISVWLMEKTPF